MPTLLDYRRRIRSVKNTQQITRAMKFVAAAKLRRAQEGVFAARPYAREILRVLRSAAARMESPVHPLLERRPEERILVVVLTGDRSLAGAFNTNVIRRAMEFLREHSSKKLQLMWSAKKAATRCGSAAGSSSAEYLNVSIAVEFSKRKEIASKIGGAVCDRRSGCGLRHLQRIQERDGAESVRREAPADRSRGVEGRQSEKGERPDVVHDPASESLPMKPSPDGTVNLVDYIYEQPVAEIFGGLVPRYLESEVFRILLESAAAEHAARMTAMDSATRNASELIDKLTLADEQDSPGGNH